MLGSAMVMQWCVMVVELTGGGVCKILAVRCGVWDAV